jgi:hypothetical protein
VSSAVIGVIRRESSPVLERPPSRQARRRERQRRYRQRAAAGIWLMPVEVDAAIVDMLIATHWLGEWPSISSELAPLSEPHGRALTETGPGGRSLKINGRQSFGAEAASRAESFRRGANR